MRNRVIGLALGVLALFGTYDAFAAKKTPQAQLESVKKRIAKAEQNLKTTKSPVIQRQRKRMLKNLRAQKAKLEAKAAKAK